MNQPCVWKPTIVPGLKVDVSDAGISRLLRDAAHKIHGAPSSEEARISTRLQAVARYMEGKSTDFSDVNVSADDADTRPILT